MEATGAKQRYLRGLQSNMIGNATVHTTNRWCFGFSHNLAKQTRVPPSSSRCIKSITG
jgi:hypothetical protein